MHENTISYDGSFPGFLCACAEALNAAEPVPRVVSSRKPESLFEARIAIARDDARAAALWDRLARRLGDEAMKTLLEAFLSDLPEADSAIAAVMVRMRDEGPAVLRDLSSPDALAVEKASFRAREEGHRFCGLVRFSELSDGSWYAPIEPSCDVLPLLGDHFAARFPGLRFAIHDATRGSAIVHESGRAWGIVEGFGLRLPEGAASVDDALSEGERTVRALWKLYFETIAIGERANPRLQMSKMPKRYWSRLTEMTSR